MSPLAALRCNVLEGLVALGQKQSDPVGGQSVGYDLHSVRWAPESHSAPIVVVVLKENWNIQSTYCFIGDTTSNTSIPRAQL